MKCQFYPNFYLYNKSSYYDEEFDIYCIVVVIFWWQFSWYSNTP